MIDDESKKFYEAIEFINKLRLYFDRIGINYIDQFRYLEMFVRRGYYGQSREKNK